MTSRIKRSVQNNILFFLEQLVEFLGNFFPGVFRARLVLGSRVIDIIYAVAVGDDGVDGETSEGRVGFGDGVRERRFTGACLVNASRLMVGRRT